MLVSEARRRVRSEVFSVFGFSERFVQRWRMLPAAFLCLLWIKGHHHGGPWIKRYEGLNQRREINFPCVGRFGGVSRTLYGLGEDNKGDLYIRRVSSISLPHSVRSGYDSYHFLTGTLSSPVFPSVCPDTFRSHTRRFFSTSQFVVQSIIPSPEKWFTRADNCLSPKQAQGSISSFFVSSFPTCKLRAGQILGT